MKIILLGIGLVAGLIFGKMMGAIDMYTYQQEIHGQLYLCNQWLGVHYDWSGYPVKYNEADPRLKCPFKEMYH